MNFKRQPTNAVRGSVTAFALAGSCALVMGALPDQVAADETCMSPYMAKIVGQEDFVYV